MPIDPLDPAVGGEDPDSEDAYRRYVVRSFARKKGLDPDLAEALTQQESGFNPQAIGYDKHGKPQGRGMMQLLPSTAAERGLDSQHIHDTVRNADIGTSYLAEMRDQHPNDPNFYVHYFTGPGGNTQTPAALNYQRKVGGYLTELQQGKKLGVPKKATPANINKVLATTRQPAVDTTQPVSPPEDAPDTTTDTAPVVEDRGHWESGQFVSEFPKAQMEAERPGTDVYQQVRGIEDRALGQLPEPPYDEKKDPDSEFNYKLQQRQKEIAQKKAAQIERIKAMEAQEAGGQGNAGQQGLRSGFYSPALPAPAERPIRQQPRGAGYFQQAAQPPIRSGFVSPGRAPTIAEQPPLTPQAAAQAEEAMKPAPAVRPPDDRGTWQKIKEVATQGKPMFPEAGEQIEAGFQGGMQSLTATGMKYTPEWLKKGFDSIDRAMGNNTVEERQTARGELVKKAIEDDPSFTGELLRAGGGLALDAPFMIAMGGAPAVAQMAILAAVHGGGVKDIAEAATVGAVLHGAGRFMNPRIAAMSQNPIVRRSLNVVGSGATGAAVGAGQNALNQLYGVAAGTGTFDPQQMVRAGASFGAQAAAFGALHEPEA